MKPNDPVNDGAGTRGRILQVVAVPPPAPGHHARRDVYVDWQVESHQDKLLKEHGFDPDAPSPTTHEERAYLDILLYGNHFDEILDDGTRRCIPADRVVISR